MFVCNPVWIVCLLSSIGNGYLCLEVGVSHPVSVTPCFMGSGLGQLGWDRHQMTDSPYVPQCYFPSPVRWWFPSVSVSEIKPTCVTGEGK